jgi:hypothetical protein
MIDLKARCNRIKSYTHNEWKTDFYTRYQHYEFWVILFAISNTVTSFQNIINEIFKDIIDLRIIIYINDLLIYSQIK